MRFLRRSSTIRVVLPLAWVIGACAWSAGCARRDAAGGAEPARPARPALVNHPVFFKLRDPLQADELIRDCDERLARIPGIVSYYCGRPLDTGRANVDGNYDVGVYVGFASQEDYAAYVTHPDHLWLVEKWKPRWEWIRVHDVLDETP